MLTRCVIFRSRLSCLSQVLTSSRYYSTELRQKLPPGEELRLSPHRQKQDQREPFAKNMFVGKYDLEFAAFPLGQTTDRYKDFMEWLKPIEDYIETLDPSIIDARGQIPKEILENLRQMDVFRAIIPPEFNGLGLNMTEFSKLVETLAAVPVLGAYLVKRVEAINYLLENSSEAQKSEILPRIASGEISPTICTTEEENGSSDTLVMSIAQLSDSEDYFHVNAKKTCVFDAANSNLFVVICECSDSGKSFRPEETMTAFMVDRNSPGIRVDKPLEINGLRGLELCNVTFNNVEVPKDNILGNIGDASKRFVATFADSKQYIGAQCIGLTKRFLKYLVQHLKADKDFSALQFKNSLIQDVIGKTTGTIYGMESVTYLTTGMIDRFYEQDCTMEKCMVEVFCTEESLHCILQGAQLVGVASQLKSEVFDVFLRDAVALTSFNGIVLNTKVMIALMGLQHMGTEIGDKIKIRRKPWNHPQWIFWKWLGYQKTPDLYIANNLHPTMKTSAEMLEYGIARLAEVLENVAVQHGREIFDKQNTHKRLTDIACALYTISAVLARTSRSYCLGMRDSDKEMYLTQVYCYKLYQKIKILADQVSDTEWYNGDMIVEDISDTTFEKDGYFIVHPLARNYD